MNALHRAANRAQATVVALEAAPRAFVTAAAEVVRANVDRQIGQDIPRRRVAGGTVGVRVKSLPGDRALISAQGPLHLENNPTRPHLIAPKGSHPLAFQVGNRTIYTNRVQHPGTRGKRTWQHGVDIALPLIHSAVEVEGASLLRSLL